MEGNVVTEKNGSILTIRLNCPENLNVLSREMGDELVTRVSEARTDPSVRAVIFTGTDRAFCAGGDLRFILDWEGEKPEAFGILTHRLNRIIVDFRHMPKPVIAAVNGVASGAGFSFVMACDLRVASDKAVFKQAYSSVGLVPDGGWTVSVARQIGMAKATEILLFDPLMTAGELYDLGLLNYVVSPDELMNKAYELAELAASKSQQAFARNKELLNHALFFGLTDQLEIERSNIMSAGDTPDFKEGITAFMEKREPRFK